MRSPIIAVAAASGFAAIVLVTAPAAKRNHEDGALRLSEVARLRAHFDSVLVELRGRDVSSLGSDQQRARAQLIGTLENYRDAGIFPHNHHFPGQRVPYFRDGHGTLCAMAYLIASTGRGDIVADVAAGRNNAYIPALAADPRLVSWLDSVGLSVREAARIQPGYGGPPITVAAEERRGGADALSSVALGLPALVTSVLNWRAPRKDRPDAALVVGALAGAAVAILGGAILVEESDASIHALGAVDVAVGATALVAAARRSVRRPLPAGPHQPVAGVESRLSMGIAPVRYVSRISPAAHVRILF